MSLLHAFLNKIDKIKPFSVAYAHCDIPCGIYDPHHAQLAAHTVIRMTKLINEMTMSGEPTFEQRKEIMHKMNRLTDVKEEHAELCKKEIRIIWGDYFKPEHVQKYPELHDLVWKIMKLGSQARQTADAKAAEDLLEAVNKFSDIFWATKNIKTAKKKAPYPTEKETVYPVL